MKPLQAVGLLSCPDPRKRVKDFFHWRFHEIIQDFDFNMNMNQTTNRKKKMEQLQMDK